MDIFEAFTFALVGAMAILALAGLVISLADYVSRGNRKDIDIYEPLDGSWRKARR